VATVDNIDWPSEKGLSTADQKAELIAILDRAAQLKLNVIIFQVRPGCDAMYASSLDPWSEYLTGTMGQAPKPFYDPLAFAIEEAHKRGLELHAWFNPYRAHHPSAKGPIAANHISQTHPELVRRYGKLLWLDPGEKGVQEYSLRVVMDVVKRYAVDGVHFDDYFYPYQEHDGSGQAIDFPDEASWSRRGAGVKLARDDWRRENVNVFIHRVYESIKQAKPWVKFGISPFGIWRPGNPPSVDGLDAFATLYADSRKWLTQGWLDYFAPQLYWSISAQQQSFPVLLKWWVEQNQEGRCLVPGLDSTRAAHRWPPEEIVNQIGLTRKQPGVAGHIHWNMGSLAHNSRLDALLENQVYAQAAWLPPEPWLHRGAPAQPSLNVTGADSRLELAWRPAPKAVIAVWALQSRRGKEWTTQILPGGRQACSLERAPEVIALTAIDRFGNASRPVVLERKGN